MKRSLMALWTVALMTLSANASILTTQPSDKQVEGVAVAKGGTVHLEGQDIAVDLIGAGLRSKKVLVSNVKVYVAELLSSDASKFVRTPEEALKSLDLSRTIAFRMTFLRNVDASTVQVSFRDALTANNVDLSAPAVAAFLQAVSNGGDAVQGKTMLIVTQKNADGSETVSYEDPNGVVTPVKGPAGFSNSLMSIWLGVPADTGLENLKAALIKGMN